MLPSYEVPRAFKIWRDINKKLSTDTPVDPDWVAQMPSTTTWEEDMGKLRKLRWPYLVCKWLRIPDRSNAFFAASYCLSTGLVLGAYLKYGASYALLLAFPFYVAAKEFHFRELRDNRIPTKMASSSMDRS